MCVLCGVYGKDYIICYGKRSNNKMEWEGMMKLKSCPLCGGSMVGLCNRKEYAPRRYSVRCMVCGLETRGYTMEEEAAGGWNRRA